LKTENAELLEFFRQQGKREEDIVKSINKAVKNLKNLVVVLVLKGISFDSAKHADLYKAAESIISVAPAMSEDELKHLQETVAWHIDNEEKLMAKLEDAIERTEDKRARFLLESIMTDEKRHHELLKTLMDTVVRGEVISDDEWWEIVWRNVPFHGAPGG
jgi:rubrerythrin